MPCYRPLPAIPSGILSKNLKFPMLVFPRTEVNLFRYKQRVPCGRCMGCRLEHSRQWAVRIVHESRLHTANSFITLTYANPPPNGSLVLEHLQKFWKRLRKRFPDLHIRYFACGEYGTDFGRPHYHACVFGLDFPDKKIWQRTRAGHTLYRSAALEKTWKYGYSSVAELTFESAAYVSRYCTKKITGDQALSHYALIDHQTGEILSDRKREFAVMSRKPGIAKYYFDQYFEDWYSSDYLLVDRKGKKVKARMPRYYDKHFELLYPEEYDLIKAKRREQASKFLEHCTTERLLVREQCKLSQVKSLVRIL